MTTLWKSLLLLVAVLNGVYGQTITGSIAGSVTDPSGLAVSGAGVTLIQPTTSVQRRTQTPGPEVKGEGPQRIEFR